MSNLPPAQTWQTLYDEALAESDPEELLPLVVATAGAIFLRSQELKQVPGDHVRELRRVLVDYSPELGTKTRNKSKCGEARQKAVGTPACRHERVKSLYFKGLGGIGG